MHPFLMGVKPSTHERRPGHLRGEERGGDAEHAQAEPELRGVIVARASR